MKEIFTPIEFMLELEWDKNSLEDAIKLLDEWNKRDHNYYKSFTKDTVLFDMKEKEHLRNCINFWKKKLNEN